MSFILPSTGFCPFLNDSLVLFLHWSSLCVVFQLVTVLQMSLGVRLPDMLLGFDGWKFCECIDLFSDTDILSFFFTNSLFNLKVRGPSPASFWIYHSFVMLTLAKTVPLVVALHYQVRWGQLVLMAAEFWKAALTINYHTVALRGSSIRFPHVPAHYSFIKTPCNLVLCVRLFEDILFNICWFIIVELMAKGTLIRAWMTLRYTRIFSMHHLFPVLMNTRQHFSIIAVGNSKNHQPQALKCKRHATKLPAERTLVYSERAGTRRQSVTLLNLRWKNECQVTQIAWFSVYIHK